MTLRLSDQTAKGAVIEGMTLIRAIAAGMVLCGLVAGLVVYGKGWAEWRILLAFSGPNGAAATAVAPEAWPICTTMGSVAADADWVQLDPDFKAGKRALAAADWNGAIAAFERAALRDPRNADIQNYIGYSYR